MTMTEEYRGFVLTWQEPPPMGNGYSVNIGSDNMNLSGILASHEATPIPNPNLLTALENARGIIDQLLGRAATR
jgi:hypothetical protein